MSLKSRGRSPGGGGGQARHGDTSGRGGSLGPGHAGKGQHLKLFPCFHKKNFVREKIWS